jgi:hypothetical protein
VQSAESDHVFVIAVGFLLELRQNRLPFFLWHLVGVFVLLAEKLLGVNFRIAAEQNVGSAAGHVGRHGDRALRPACATMVASRS